MKSSINTILFFLLLTAILSGPAFPQKGQLKITASSAEVLKYYTDAEKLACKMKFDAAMDLLQKAVKADPNFAMGYLRMAEIARNDFEKSKAYLDKALSLTGSVSEGEKDWILLMKARFEGPIQDYKTRMEKLDALYPKDKAVQYTLGKLYYEDFNNYSLASEHLKQAIDADRKYAAPYGLLGSCYARLNDDEKAENVYLDYIKLGSDDAAPYYYYADYLLRSGRYTDSRKQNEKALEKDPSFFQALNSIGTNYAMRGDYETARTNFRKAFDQASSATDKLEAMYNEAISYLYEGKINEAVSLMEKSKTMSEQEKLIDQEFRSLLGSGVILSEMGRAVEGVKYFEQASALITNSTLPGSLRQQKLIEANLGRCRAMIEKGDLAEAHNLLNQCREVEKSEPQKMYFNTTLGALAIQEGKYDEALQYLADGNRESPLNWYYTGLAYEKKKDANNANDWFAKVARCSNNSVELGIARALSKEALSKR
ncbi:MAG: tetratricopeptide repeat protein [Ignavibacteria bacterium]|jgi:tetratricopeptide (TPR) repeat protein|nr:tetratricopeptide repeat protein [Ignavibacteria bacterium]MCU7502147.1 tetratricopeptide repeat protein [Ignavibacteria bacterium]MCU7515549.1 tetratricopeptide repeat protein [Ignavibacteria bacterium]